jgi:hypothetical protein
LLAGSITPLLKSETTMDDNNDDENAKKSMPSIHRLSIDDMPKENLSNELDRSHDDLQNESSKKE